MGDAMKFNMPKRYYCLEEVASVWECSVDDLLNYAEQDLLSICVRPELHPHPVVAVLNDGTNDEGAWISRRTPPYDLYPISRTAVTGVKDEPFNCGDSKGYTFLSPSPDSEIKYWRGYFKRERMFVLHGEKERFEKNALKLQKDITKPIGRRAEKSYLRLIGALLQTVMDGEKFSSEAELKDYIARNWQGFEGCSTP
jgi:hypothetical protein